MMKPRVPMLILSYHVRFALVVAILFYLGFLIVLSGLQRSLIYYPQLAAEDEVILFASRVGLEEWRDERNELIGWKAKAPEGKGPLRRVVVFHGNAGMAIDRTNYVHGFQWPPNNQRWEVRIFEYPGYGARKGSPGEKVFYRAAREALKELFATDEAPLFLVGESLGSGVASRMASEFPERIDGLALITTFTSLTDVAARHFPFIPVRLLMRERYDNAAALEDYNGPVAVLLAGDDEVIPVDLGERLYEGYRGPKRLWIQDGRTHNWLDLDPGSVWWRDFAAFIEEHGA